MDAAPRVQLAAGGGLLTSGAYFGGPGGLEFGNGQAFTGQLELIAKVRPAFSLVLGAAHARPDWQLKGVPLVGSVQLPGARLWFVDAAVRGELSLGPGAGAVTVFAQAGPALVRYSFNTLPLGIAIERHATNVALGAGVGSALPLTGAPRIEVMAKDYIASFKSIRDFEAFGVEGRRAHTDAQRTSRSLNAPVSVNLPFPAYRPSCPARHLPIGDDMETILTLDPATAGSDNARKELLQEHTGFH